MSKSIEQTEQTVVAEVDAARLMETNAAIAQYTRHSGTDEEREAFLYVQRTLDEYGLHTTLLEHPALISYPLDAKLEVIDDAGKTLVEYPCLGAAFSATVDNFEAEVADVEFGSPEDFARVDVCGKVALINGLATPTAVYAAEQAGAVGHIFINDDHLHYMIVSSIWGTPTPDSAERMPSTPAVSVVEKDGHDLRARVKAGTVRVRISSRVFMDWQQTPLLVADLESADSDEFVMFSGHLDSWEVGAMDNGSANATMLEVARILAQHKDALVRGMRLIFWSGHSHGRYSGSTWYVDNHWEELYDRCAAHVNVDSTGARGAMLYKTFLAHRELGALGAEIIRLHTGQESKPRRMSRAGDMSFNGVGIPALFMTLSEVPISEADQDYVSLAAGKLLGSKLPWWWHTSEDTMDKVDPDVLALDTKIYVSALWRLCTNPLLPMDFRPVVSDIVDTLKELQSRADDHLDLSLALDRVNVLGERVAALAEQCAHVSPDDRAAIDSLNKAQKALSRILIPVTYAAASRFDHDPAWGLPHLPALADVPKLAQLESSSDEYGFLRTQLVRNRNAVNFALRQAIEALAKL